MVWISARYYLVAKCARLVLGFHVNLQCILSGMNYIVALGQTQQKNCVGLYVRQQKVNGRLRIPDAALTLFSQQNTHTYTLASKTDHKATNAQGYTFDHKNSRKIVLTGVYVAQHRLHAWTWTWTTSVYKMYKRKASLTSDYKNHSKWGLSVSGVQYVMRKKLAKIKWIQQALFA